MKHGIYLWAFIGLMMVCGCSSKKVTTTAFHEYPTECLGTSMDGKQVLRVWATGQNRADAVEQAKKKRSLDTTGGQIGLERRVGNRMPSIIVRNGK